MKQNPNRNDALDLLHEYTKSESLRRHALAVEQVMREYAVKYNADQELWGITGLLHDFDYEKHPTAEEHPFIGNKILEEKGYAAEIREAIMGHATYTGVERISLMSKVLFAVDELTGFIFAVTFVRPSKSIHEVKVKSVTKKLKNKAFAASVSRDDVEQGITELGVERSEHIAYVIEALKKISDDIGLTGDIG